MVRLRTKIATLLSLLPFWGPVHASQDITRTIAGCTGRFSAEMEHSWLISDDRAEAFQDERATFVFLLEAAMQSDHRAILGHRIEVKHAHASLLTVASFSADRTRARSARALADEYLDSCRSLILGG